MCTGFVGAGLVRVSGRPVISRYSRRYVFSVIPRTDNFPGPPRYRRTRAPLYDGRSRPIATPTPKHIDDDVREFRTTPMTGTNVRPSRTNNNSRRIDRLFVGTRRIYGDRVCSCCVNAGDNNCPLLHRGDFVMTGHGPFGNRKFWSFGRLIGYERGSNYIGYNCRRAAAPRRPHTRYASHFRIVRSCVCVWGVIRRIIIVFYNYSASV